MIATVIAIVCGLTILWAIEMRLNELTNKNVELMMDIFKLRTELDKMKSKIGGL